MQSGALLHLPASVKRIVVLTLTLGFIASLALLVWSVVPGSTDAPDVDVAVSLFKFVASGAALAIVAFFSTKNISTAQLLVHTTAFLTEEMPRAFKASLLLSSLTESDWSTSRKIDDVSKAVIKVDHVRGTPSATYVIEALGSRIQMRITLNAFRFVVLYYIRCEHDVTEAGVANAIEMVRVGAEQAGYASKIDTNPPLGNQPASAEVYFYRMAEQDLLLDTSARLFWSQDIAVMTKSMILQLQRHSMIAK